jgi:8-oxo-dGTP diphosphatase
MLIVTCAIIRNEENKVLVVQRGEATDHPFKWEFPGGKLATAETAEDCIIREVEEELSMEIVICSRLPKVEYDYGHKQIALLPFICDTLNELPVLSEHIDFKWVEEKDLMTPDYSEADIFVAKSYLERTENENSEEKQIIRHPADDLPENIDLQSFVYSMMGRKEAEWLAASAIDNPATFMKLFEYSLSPDKSLSFRASWTLTKVCDRFPEIIYPYLGQFAENLCKIENESTIRSFLRIISLSDLGKLNSHQHGLLADFCFRRMSSGISAIAVKAYAMEILYKLTTLYPELANELYASINILMEDGSAGITARGRNILKKLSEMPAKPESHSR